MFNNIQGNNLPSHRYKPVHNKDTKTCLSQDTFPPYIANTPKRLHSLTTPTPPNRLCFVFVPFSPNIDPHGPISNITFFIRISVQKALIHMQIRNQTWRQNYNQRKPLQHYRAFCFALIHDMIDTINFMTLEDEIKMLMKFQSP
ncbi:hypothetical protein VIGAN_05270800 [Vigna angularis var. angularis]|uniref:Uncharacterized protein n=1 Tax=Vigna angularis var. angularis TaxID=157739 RepID=A0A0S3S8B2_PHAAN|nr:hypothetical protein VIGAN_05270800 [Vigna angularis var. angularis]